MATIEKPWGLKHKLDLEEDKEQNTSEVQVPTERIQLTALILTPLHSRPICNTMKLKTIILPLVLFSQQSKLQWFPH